jgi:hypothetical protein
MILQDVKAYLKENGQASTGEITAFLGADRQVVMHALHLLMQKGQVDEAELAPPCLSRKGCSSCPSHQPVLVYRLAPAGRDSRL